MLLNIPTLCGREWSDVRFLKLRFLLRLQKDENNKEDYNFESYGEWNNDFVALNSDIENEAEARKQANQVLDDVNRNVVMI